MFRSLLLSFLVLTCAIAARAQSLSGFERVLVPVYSFNEYLPGPGGVFFNTTYLGAYSEKAFRYWPGTTPEGNPNQIVEVPPGEQPLVLPRPAAPSITGRLVYVDPADSNSVAFGIKVRVLRPGENRRQTVGTVPVVREREFITGRSQMLLIPFHFWQSERDPGVGPFPELEVTFRHQLRVYDVDLRGNLEIIVRVFHRAGVDEARYKLTERDGEDASYPYYASVQLEPKCFRMPGTLCISYEGRVEIEPVDASSRYWAMVSSTNNRTHDFAVTVAKPVGGA